MASVLPLSELTLLIRRGIAPHYSATGVLVLNQKCIRQYRCEWNQGRRHDADTRPVKPDLLVTQGDVLVNSTGVGTLGRVAPIRRPPPEHTITDGHITLVRPDPRKIEPEYFGWAMVNRQAEIEAMGTGATGQTELSALRLANEVFVRVPTRQSQRRIASILSTYYNLIENNTRRIAILEEMARRVFEEWFVHFRAPGCEALPMVDSAIGPVPQGWEVASISDVTQYVNRGIAPKYTEDGPSLIINQKCIRSGVLSLYAARRQEKAVPHEKIVQPHDVLINSTGVGTLGRVAQVITVPNNCTVDSHVTIVRPSTDVDPTFFGISLLGLELAFAAAGVGSTGQTELQRERIRTVPFLRPPFALQRRYGETARPTRRLMHTLSEQNSNLRAQRDLLLPKLISGEIEVSSPPAPLEEAAE